MRLRQRLLAGAAIGLVCSPAWAQFTGAGTPNYVTIGSGAPANGNAAAGNVWCQTDLPVCWVTSGPSQVPTFVQAAANNGTWAVTLSKTPTNGNYLIGFCFNNSGTAPSANTGAGWAAIAGSSTAPGASGVASEKKVSGDGTTVTPCTGGSGSEGVNVIEVSNLNASNFSNSLENVTTGGGYRVGTLSMSHTTTNSNDLVLAGAASAACSITGFTGTGGTGWTTGANDFANFGNGNAYGPAPASSTAMNAVFHSGCTGAWQSVGIMVTLNPPTGRGVGWALAAGEFDSINHMQMQGVAPTVTSCGTETLDSGATDSSGQINITAGTPGSCTLTFKNAYTTIDHCGVWQEPGTIASFAYSYTLSAITITGTTMSGKIDYRCDGY